MNKTALKQWLRENSTPEEIAEMDRLDALEEQKEKIAGLEQGVSQLSEKTTQAFSSSLNKVVRAIEMSMQLNQEMVETISSKFTELAPAFENAVAKHKGADLSGFYKDFGTQIAQWAKSSEGTKELIQNLKWNASQQLRDVNGSPVNPAIAPFGITVNYDDIQLTYTGDNITKVDYYQANSLKATLVLTYAGDNLVEVLRTN